MFMFQSNKTLHILQILVAGIAGVGTEQAFQVPTADQIVHWLQIGVQVITAVVACIAAIRKAVQKPIVAPVQTQDNVPA